jgi:hypothetical protein
MIVLLDVNVYGSYGVERKKRAEASAKLYVHTAVYDHHVI